MDGEQRRELPALITAHIRGMHELLRQGHATDTQPWARLWSEGHGDHWALRLTMPAATQTCGSGVSALTPVPSIAPSNGRDRLGRPDRK